MNKTLLTYAVIGGLFGALFFVGPVAFNKEYYYNPDNFAMGEVIGYSVMFISMLPVFLGTRAYRNRFFTDAPFTFGKGLTSGLLITIISSFIFYLGNVLVYEVIAPGFLEEFGVHYKQYMLEAATNNAEREAIAAEFDSMSGMMSNSYLYGLIMASSVLMMGIVISLVSALILRRNEIAPNTNSFWASRIIDPSIIIL